MSFDERGGVPVRRPSSEGRRSASLFQFVSSFGYSASGTAISETSRSRATLGTVLLGLVVPVLLLTTWWIAAESPSVHPQ